MFDRLQALGDRARRRLLQVSGLELDTGTRPPLQFLFTVDTEISLGGALDHESRDLVGADLRIWGDTDHGAFGIGTMMNLLDKYEHRGVFFFETNASNLIDETELANAARCISSRGHEVQLHLHPEFNFESIEAARENPEIVPDYRISSMPLDKKIRELKKGCDILESWTGQRPTAFRAGAFAASNKIFEAVKQAGLRFDSSVNSWAKKQGDSQIHGVTVGNDALCYKNGVVEIPVTCFAARGIAGGLRQLDFAATSISEMIWVLEAMYASGARTATGITHSFRLIRTTDTAYREVRPDHVNVYRLEGFFRYLHAHRDRFRMVGFNQLQGVEGWIEPSSAHRVQPVPPWWASGLRLAVQGIKDHGAV